MLISNFNNYQIEVIDNYFKGSNGKYNHSPEDVIYRLEDAIENSEKYHISIKDALLTELEECNIEYLEKEKDLFDKAFKTDEDLTEFMEQLSEEISVANQEAQDYYESMMFDYQHNY